mmetsp:Transcript_40797/g.46776  ORF Transcript_40797/g.46776 Transcript_40797/m.46776 type:complete len:97 (+) Transcript_40797:3255-3545(+)
MVLSISSSHLSSFVVGIPTSSKPTAETINGAGVKRYPDSTVKWKDSIGVYLMSSLMGFFVTGMLVLVINSLLFSCCRKSPKPTNQAVSRIPRRSMK